MVDRARGPAGLLGRAGVRRALLLGPLLLLIFLEPVKATTDPDYWWHFRTGQYIFETRSVPTADLFSYTAAGRPWIAHEWLTELLFYLVSLPFGYLGNVVLYGFLGVATGLVVYATCRRWGLGELASALLMTWSSAMAEPMFNVRPQIITALLVAVLVWLLVRYRQGEPRALWLIPPLFALWVNLHGGYIIGLALLGLMLAGEGATWLLRYRLDRPVAPLRPLFGVTALAGLATLLNPHGFEAWRYPFSYLGTGNASMMYVGEWQSPSFHELIFLPFAAGLLAAILVGIGRRPLGIAEALWTVALAFLGLQSGRNVMLVAVVVVPLIGARLAADVPALRGSLAAWRKPAVLVATSLCVLTIAVATTVRQASLSGLQLGREPSVRNYPAGAVDYLQAHPVVGNLFNEYGWGGYLIYRLYPERRVFIDGRIDVYGDSFAKKYLDVVVLHPNWQTILHEYDVRIALVQPESPLAVTLGSDSAWQRVYQGDDGALFVRNGPPGARPGGATAALSTGPAR